jgi:hypothetical protein
MYSLAYYTFLILVFCQSIVFSAENLYANENILCVNNLDLYQPIIFSDENQHKNRLMQWKTVWELTSIDKYIDYYSKDFNNKDKNYQQWKKHKHRIFFKNAQQIQITLSEINIYQSLKKQNSIRILFTQDYNSPNYSSKENKEQIWQLEDDNHWRIVYENTLKKSSCVDTVIHNQIIFDDFFIENNVSFTDRLEQAISFEKIKSNSNFKKAMAIYLSLIKTKQGDERLIARLRLARLYIQYKQLTNHYTKALEQLAIVEKAQKSSYLVFTYYIHAIIYARGYGVSIDKNKALAYHKKYQQLLETRIKTSVFLQDFSLTSSDRLKQVIKNSGQEILNWKDKQNIPLFWQDKPFCKRDKFNPICYNPDWSINDCQKVFYNDQMNHNLCTQNQCNQASQPCFELVNIDAKKSIALYQKPSKTSQINGYLDYNSRYIMLDSPQYNWDNSVNNFTIDSWVGIMWCETGPVIFLNQCQGDTETGYIKNNYLKLIEYSKPVKWVKKQ